MVRKREKMFAALLSTAVLLSAVTASGFAEGDVDAPPPATVGDTGIEEVKTVTLLQTAAAGVVQIGSQGYSSLGDAIDAANGSTIELLGDLTPNAAVTVSSGKSCTIDLKGHKLDLGSNSLTNVGTLTITGNGTITSANHTIVNKGKLTIAGGTIDATAHAKAALYNDTNGTASITGGTLTRSQEKGASPTSNGGNSWYVVYNAGRIEKISGCTIEATGKFSSLICNKGTSSSPAVINSISGGNFSNEFVVLKNDEYGEIGTITGGIFTAGTDATKTAVLLNYGKIGSITGGSFINKGEFLAIRCSNDASDIIGTIGNISGGTFQASTVLRVDKDSENGKDPSIAISNGTFTGELVRWAGTLTITGGRFSVNPSEFVTGDKPVELRSGYYWVDPPVESEPSSSGSGSSSSKKDRDSGGSGGSVSSTKPAQPKPVTTSTATATASKAIKAAASGDESTANVKFQNVTTMPPEAFASVAKEAQKAGVTAIVSADTMKGKAVETRISVDPVKAAALDSPINLSATLGDKSVENLFAKYYKNPIRIVKFAQKGAFGLPVSVATAVNLKGLDEKSLVFYRYDISTNQYVRIPEAAYYIDRNGYLHITIEYGGHLLITDRVLTKK